MDVERILASATHRFLRRRHIGKLCIEVKPTDKIAFLSEVLCIGCGICVKKCPFEAIQIINLPTNLETEVTHRYTANAFKLHRLPTPRPGQVLGLVGTNGIGKSTALKILANKLKPNLGKYDNPPDWQAILKHFRGSELQNYFTKVLEDELKAIIKPQYVDHIPRMFKEPTTVRSMLDKKAELDNKEEMCINIFLEGFIPTENLRFRHDALSFKMSETADEVLNEKTRRYSYPTMTKTLGTFKLSVEGGAFTDSEIIVMLGENGMGKTTLIKLLAGRDSPDQEEEKLNLSVSLKPQKIAPQFPGTVRGLLLKRIKPMFMNPQFETDVLKPMNLEAILDQDVKTLSGGELQRVAVVLALGLQADVYLLDEPSSFLDSEQRIIASKVIKRFVLHAKRTAFVIEHDFIMATYLADRVIVFEGTPAVSATATPPQSLLTGMNKFLASLEITFRRDPTNFRPRVNKAESVKDREQKGKQIQGRQFRLVGLWFYFIAAGTYFFLED
ncbi:Fe-S cluster-binding ribosome biosynthesis protein [Serendipita sp. 397]|nr:Fe-S cluster-binding ribosome biosynthesis protein [Serendipita sp. 397]